MSKSTAPEAARYGLTVADVQQPSHLASAARTSRKTSKAASGIRSTSATSAISADNSRSCAACLLATPSGAQIPIGEVASISFSRGPAMIRDEDGAAHRLCLHRSQHDGLWRLRRAEPPAARAKLKLPAGYTYQWSGEYEFQLRAKERLKMILPVVFFVIFLLLYMVFHSVAEAAGADLSHVLCDDRRADPAVAARLQLQRRRVGRLHRAVRHRGGDRRRHGRVSA